MESSSCKSNQIATNLKLKYFSTEAVKSSVAPLSL